MELITGSALQEITGASCNQESRLQAVITGAICNSALQDGAVITGNRPVEIGPLDMSQPDDAGSSESVCERVKGDYVSYVLNSDAGSENDLPGSIVCQPAPIPPCFLSNRAYAASLSPGELPDRCPSCGSRAVAVLFWADTRLDLLDCAGCGAIFSGRPT